MLLGAPRPNPALRSLDVMVGMWNLKGRKYGADAMTRAK